ncbi:primosomal protein N' [Balneolaceae bacterium YR4-1]|uniref:Replication restart protein PriA n=1 Tax=Halalkalibaculum roseum TaxID=2709311 RepID=A0A6M1T043_9BACT|nr:primosomal protein N' [Halalkalibaculum roseum]
MPRFADIIFPTAVRQPFTYQIPENLQDEIKVGLRVWVPFQRRKSIGVVVNLHSDTPDFNTRDVEQILDDKPILSPEMMKLTKWIHRFYYCGWGEVIQAALPAGLNFYSEKYILIKNHPGDEQLDNKDANIIEEVAKKESYLLKEAKKRWSAAAIDRLQKRGYLEVREEPELKVAPSTSRLWEWTPEGEQEKVLELINRHREEDKMYKWVEALELLHMLGLPEFQKNLTRHELLDSYTLNRIADEGLISAREVESTDISFKYEYDPSALKKLNDEQEMALVEIKSSLDKEEFANYLLFGITGSGKTEVYIHALREVLDKGKGGLVLVPEIGLTPQIVKRFYQIFGDDIAVLHSRLTVREKYDAWRSLQKGEKRIAIGARSAVFAPVQNLGLIIVDEEHDASYKQEDPAPRYHARDVAIMRGTINDAAVVMGSATPSMVSLYGAKKGKSKLLSLTKRPLDAKLPKVKVLDLKQYRSAMQGPVAVPLYEKIKEAVDKNEQAILLYNRRGYASFLQCETCGHIPECPNCSVSLTFHKSKRQLRCHYCGYAARRPEVCGECGKADLEAMGSGTQQLEEQISDIFPEVRLLRMDFDTTSGRDAHADILAKFARKEADILVGTQIVGKGLDFPDVTVVGVINADTELAFPTFRAGERMYQLLSQVAGRSGRADKEGKVYFQTWQADHPALMAAKNHDYKEFARRELAFRKTLKYPPYSRIIRFVFKGKREQRVQRVARVFTETLIEQVGGFDSVLGPSPSAVSKVQKFYRWETLLKIDPSNGAGAIEHLLDNTFSDYEHRKPDKTSSVRINVNVDALE